MKLLNSYLAKQFMADIRMVLACLFIAMFSLQIILPAVRDISGLVYKYKQLSLDNPYESDNDQADEDGQASAKKEIKSDVFLSATILVARQVHCSHLANVILHEKEHLASDFIPETPTPPPDSSGC